MNKTSLATLIMLLTLGSALAVASGPVVFPDGDAAWTVDITPKGSSQPTSGASIQKAEITQVSQVKRIVLHWSDGKTTQNWSLPKLPVIFDEDPRDGTVTPFQNRSLMMKTINATLTYDSFAFDWVTPESLQSKDPVSYKTKQCFHYSAGGKEAWVDSQTLLPVALDNGTSESDFTFQATPPTGPLVMPPKVAKAIHYFKIAMGYP